MTTFLLIVGIGVLFIIIFSIGQKKISKKEVDLNDYEKVDSLMNKSEFMLFRELQKQLKDQFLIFAKVRMEDYVHVKKGLESKKRYGLRSRIKSRHTDFLICDQQMKPLMAIELDGGSHNNRKSAESDQFKDGVYREIDLLMKRIRVGDRFEMKVHEIFEMLNQKKL